MTTESNSRKVETDITVYGATGFVGRHVCKYLLAAAATHDDSSSSGPPFRLTIAGRNADKLDARKESLQDDIGKSAVLDVFVADSSDKNALVQMAKRTTVVLNCAGPFINYGTHVVAACAETGADYVDITGEVTWAGRMRAIYGPAAQTSGARIISLCGFDSVPSEMSIFAAVQALKDLDKNIQVEYGRTWHCTVGSMNGGTLHSALNMPINLRDCLMSKDDKGKYHFRKVPLLLEDPMVLTNPTKVRHNPEYLDYKNKMAASEWWNQLPSWDYIVRGGVSIPFFMAVVNAKVVHASAVALKYGPNFTYNERFYPMGFKWTKFTRWVSIIPAVIFQGIVLALSALFLIPLVGQKLADWILPPGSGLGDSVLEKMHAQVYAEAVSEEDGGGCVHRGTCFMSFEGDPGNYVTAQCVGESALSLVYNRSELPPRSLDGFGTPAELLGPVLLKRLAENKVRKVEITTKLHKRAPKDEMRIFMYD